MWRLALLFLPWQTRLFFDGPKLMGYPWEQGRISVYISMLFIVLYLFFLIHKKHFIWPFYFQVTTVVGFLLFTLTIVFSQNIRASLIWTAQLILLLSFFINLWKKRSINREKMSAWFCASMIIPAVLGIGQFFTQKIFASTLLGIAEQQPSALGVSVIEMGAQRILRAYGSFPHPNIFGGWLVFALVGAIYLAIKNQSRMAIDRKSVV